MSADRSGGLARGDAEQPLSDLSHVFAPRWARESPGAVRHPAVPAEERHPPRRDDRRRGPGNDRRPARAAPPRGGKAAPRPPARDGAAGTRRAPSAGGSPSLRRPSGETAAPPLPLEIRLLPEPKALGTIIRRIQVLRRAIPLRDVARLFLENDASLLVRIEPAGNETPPPAFCQCRLCGMPALGEEEVREHLLNAHLEDFYDAVESEGEPPGGSFSCVARCGLSGELLGPPNHHSFGLRVQEMLRTRFAGMSEEEYRRHIETIRDPALVEEWRETRRRRLLYRRKTDAAGAARTQDAPADDAAPAMPPAPGGGETASATVAEAGTPPPALERHIAEMQLAREIAPLHIGRATHLVCPAAVLRNIPNRRLADAIRLRLDEERRRSGSLFFALRGAFRHRGLHLFRAGDARGPEFVMGQAPVPLDTVHAVAEVRQIASHVASCPGCTRQTLVAALAPPGDPAAQTQLLTRLNWLIEKGHLIEFFNGALALPAEYPVFSPPRPPPTGAGRTAGR